VNIILLGSPGSGKGTQAKLLGERYGLKHISSGDLLRAAAARKDELGREIEHIIASGKLVPDPVVLGLVRDALLASDGGGWKGWMLDGYPRTAGQAEALEDVLSGAREIVDAVVFIDVDAEEAVRRLSDRRTCPSCQAVYHLRDHPPKEKDTCDTCGATLIQRSDDRPETIRERLKIYDKETLPVLGFYDLRYDVHRVEGTAPIGDITNEIARLVNL
jgi:adenylate kinase